MQTSYLGRATPGTVERLAPPLPQSQPESHRPNNGRPNDTTANAVSFGFIATAVLISIFLVIAIFERLLGPRRPLASLSSEQNSQLELSRPLERNLPIRKTEEQHSKVDYTKGVSVLMPGQAVPTYIARPVPYEGSLESSNKISQEHDISSDVKFQHDI